MNYKRTETIFLFFVFWVYFCFFLGPHLRHMKVPKIGVKLELQLPAYATVTATQDLSHACNLHSSRPRQILNPLSKARDWTHSLMDTSWVHYCWATTETPYIPFWSGFCPYIQLKATHISPYATFISFQPSPNSSKIPLSIKMLTAFFVLKQIYVLKERNDKQLFLHFYVIYIYFLVKYLFMPFANVLTEFYFILFVCLFFSFLEPLPWHMEVPRLGVQSEL